MLEVEGGQLGMLRAFSNHEPRDGRAAREDEFLDEGEEWAFEELLRRHVGGFHLLADGIEVRGDDALHHRLEQRLLGLEVEIGEAFADTRTGRHVLEPGRGVALGREFLEGRRHDLLRARVLPLAATRAGTWALAKDFLSGHGFAPSMDAPQYND